MSKWPWPTESVAQTWMARFRQRRKELVQNEHERQKADLPKSVGRPKATVVTGYLIFDDSVHSKPKGRKMAGLGQHFSNSEQRTVTDTVCSPVCMCCWVNRLFLQVDPHQKVKGC